MKIIVLGRALFNEYLTRKGITNDNVEQQDKIFFISINNHDDKQSSYFSSNKKNIISMIFGDLEQDTEVDIIGENRKEVVKAMTQEQAAELYAFIKANKDKEAVIIHCTAGVSRSGAIGVFINDFIGGNWEELKRLNPNIQPNAHVYRLLHDEWYKDISNNDAITGKPLTFRPYIPDEIGQADLSQEQLVAMYNARHPEQHTSIQNMTPEEIKQKFPDQNDFITEIINPKSTYYLDEVGKMPINKYKGFGYEAGETKLEGIRFIHPDGSSTYAVGIDPYSNEPEFDSFWLETNQYYGMVNEQELEIVKELHPDLREIYPARKKMLRPGEFEAFASFGFGNEYTGIDLSTWLKLKNMTSFFKDFGTIITDDHKPDRNVMYGADGQQFQLPLNKKFKYLDILDCGFKDVTPLFVTNTPVQHVVKATEEGNVEYWVHTVVLVTNETGRFFPGKYLIPGTRFQKL